MSKINKSLLFLFIASLAIFNKSWGQSPGLNPLVLHIFNQDSLRGFDENSARAIAINDRCFGNEFKVRMFQLKRQFVDNKYNLVRTAVSTTPQYSARTAVVPGCTNEDFEASATGLINSSTQINGWNLTSGTNLTGADNCIMNPVTAAANGKSELIDCGVNGYVDPNLGSQYRIFSVFGSGAANALGATANPQVTSSLFGGKVLRLNDSITNDYSMQKLSKTFAVSASNALFQFAFISVISSLHPCCIASGFQIKLSNGGTPISCPSFSVWAPSSQCTAGDGQALNYFKNKTNTPYNAASTTQEDIYNKWKINSIDLTSYIGQNITIDITAYDCKQGGHYGYIYLDAQCGPMTIFGNGTGYPAGVTSATVPTCGASGATLCAADGLGPYSWAGPGVGPPYTTPALTNQCYVTNLSGTYTLYMNPAGSCAPIQRVISATITPAPLLYASAVQAACGNTTAIVTVTPSGSASVPSTITWTPAPLSYGTNSLSATYAIPVGPAPIIVTITATDPLGCLVVATATVKPAAPIPTFTITNVTGTSSITCNQSFVNLTAQSTYTYGTLSYTWSSPSTFSTGDDVAIFAPEVFTVTALDPVSNCSVVHNYTVGINQTPPSVILTPTNQIINCTNLAPQTISATATPTINMIHYFYAPTGGTVSAASYTAIYVPGLPGTYTYVLVNNLTGCSITRTLTVASSDQYPSISITSSVANVPSFTLGCSSQSVALVRVDGQTNPIGGSATFTLLPPGYTGTYGYGSNTSYNVNTPGIWTAVVKNPSPSFCETKIQFSIIQNIDGPDIHADVPTSILSCDTRSTVLTAVTRNTNVQFTWKYTGVPGSQAGYSIAVNTTTNTQSSSVDTYTLQILDNTNLCISTLTVPIRQNLYPPKAGISGGASLSITCNAPSVNFISTSTTTIPSGSGLPTNSFVVAALWEGPSPQLPLSLSTSYVGSVAGTYTLTAKDLNNGCTSQTTTLLADAKNYPVVNNPTGPPDFVLDCGANNVKIYPIISSSVTNLSYFWTAPSQASTSAVSGPTLTTNSPGEYKIIVTNNASGCFTPGRVNVVNGVLSGDFVPNVTSGYAPLAVTFSNASSSSLGTTSIVSVWNYGNGTTNTFSNTTDGSAVYTQPGTYTVTLYSSKGTCTDIDSKVITVDIPSKLEAPNVFTPNGDGINDLYFLKVANMTEINARIFDRWGHQVYELNSSTGNIAWDGTNQVGTKVAAGVYFYVIKGKGKDDKDYDQKGTITLYR